MEPILLGVLPDELQTWRGTAAELAEQCNKLLPSIGLPEEAGSANERLIRHYVQVGVLTPPEREGREALFGPRQVAEFLAARHLIHDGWPLAKIAELIRSGGPEGLARLVPAPRTPTAAEQALARLRESAAPRYAARRKGLTRTRAEEWLPPVALSTPSPPEALSLPDIPPIGAIPGSAEPRGAGPMASFALEEPSLEPLRQAHEISARRLDLRKSLTDLGNESGKPERRRTLRISLTPWCHVYVDARDLKNLPADTPDILGNALTQALHEERLRKGEKP